MMETNQAKEKAMNFKLFLLIAGIATVTFGLTSLTAKAQEARPFAQ